MALCGIYFLILVDGILLLELLNCTSADMDALCCVLPDELRVKILYYLRFDSTALMELQKTEAFNRLIRVKDSSGNIVDKVDCTRHASFLQKYLYYGTVKHLFTLKEFFPNTWSLRCIEDPVDLLFSNDNY